MAGRSPWAYFSEPVSDVNFNGGLNSAGGNLSLQDNESSSLQNVDLNFLGSVSKRNGYTALNTSAISASPVSDGLWWYESTQLGSLVYNLIAVTGGNIYYMSSFDGTWHSITGSNTITAGNFCCFENFFNILYVTNGVDAPFQVTGTGNSIAIPALKQNSYTFSVSGIITAPTVGATYTNNSVTFTIIGTNLVVGSSGIAGTIVVTGLSQPLASGNLIKTSGTGDSNITYTQFAINTNITAAKYVEQYNNYLFLANVTANGVYYPTRIYWSNLQDPTTWLTTSFIEVSENDGQQITGMKVLGNNLIIFKTRSIYIISFTGDPDVPFILQGGGKANSDVGCVSHFSIQEVQNGLMFFASDGLYYFDGFNSQKVSDRINPTILGLNQTRLTQARSLVQRNKHRYMLSVPSSSSSNNDTIIVWDWYLNAFSIYIGMSPAAMCTTYNLGYQEGIYFGDYSGFYYTMDTGPDDYPLNVQTAINAYYYTNWKAFGDLIDEMVVLHCVLYYQLSSSILTFSYSYDFSQSDDYILTFSSATSGSIYGTALYGTGIFGGSGGGQQRIDLDSRGRVIRFKFSNSNLGETFRIDGLGEFPNVETEQ